MVDLQAELEERQHEAAEGAKRLGLDYFVQMGFPDAALAFTQQAVQALIPHLRKAAPRLIFTLHQADYHPDHVAASKITEAAAFAAQLKKHAQGGGEWHYEAILYFSADMRTNPQRPQLLFDISDVIEEKRQACDAHASQEVTEFALGYSQSLGRMAGVPYAEGLYLGQVLVMDEVKGLLRT